MSEREDTNMGVLSNNDGSIAQIFSDNYENPN